MNGARISAIWWNAEWISCLAYWLCSWWMLGELLAFASFHFLTANDGVFLDTCVLLLLLFRCVCERAGCHIPTNDVRYVANQSGFSRIGFIWMFLFFTHRVNLLEQTQKPLHSLYSTSLFTIKWPQWFSKFYANKIYLLHCYTRRVLYFYLLLCLFVIFDALLEIIVFNFCVRLCTTCKRREIPPSNRRIFQSTKSTAFLFTILPNGTLRALRLSETERERDGEIRLLN